MQPQHQDENENLDDEVSRRLRSGVRRRMWYATKTPTTKANTGGMWSNAWLQLPATAWMPNNMTLALCTVASTPCSIQENASR